MLKMLKNILQKKKISNESLKNNEDVQIDKISEQWYTPYPAMQLLNTPLRQKLLELIWKRVSMDKKRFDNLYIKAINNYVDIVQLLPASESHHHSYLGGMIDHGLEVVNYALKLRQPYLLPIGGNPEDIPKQTEAWSAAVMYGGLLYDIGKVVADIHVEMNNGQTWYPWAGNISLPYRFSYNQKKDYSLHHRAAALMIHSIIPREGLIWLSKFPDLFPLFLNLCAGHHEKAGILAEIIQKADMSSVANNLGGDPTKVLVKPVQSLMSKMITSIRYLVSSELYINGQRDSDAWFDGSDLWVVSKTVTDKMKANLLQNGITDVPTDNAKIYNILKEHGIAIANSENKIVWSCKVESDNGWVAEKLTLIRIPVNVAYNNVTHAPQPFKGKIVVLDSIEQMQFNECTPISMVSTHFDTPFNQEQTIQVGLNHTNHDIDATKQSSNSLNDTVLNLFNEGEMESISNNAVLSELEEYRLLPLANENNEKEVYITSKNDNMFSKSQVITQTISSNDVIYNNPFLQWIRSQIISRQLPVNTKTACIHIVDNKVFLVTPKIFQKYSIHIHGNDDYDYWHKIQLEFQAMKIHLKFIEENFNIWKCFISGKRKNNAVIKGYLIQNRSLFSIDEKLPNNPHLTIIHDIELYKKY